MTNQCTRTVKFGFPFITFAHVLFHVFQVAASSPEAELSTTTQEEPASSKVGW
jgi:hypothetical protein